MARLEECGPCGNGRWLPVLLAGVLFAPGGCGVAPEGPTATSEARLIDGVVLAFDAGEDYRGAALLGGRRVAQYEESTYVGLWEWVKSLDIGRGGRRVKSLVVRSGPASNWEGVGYVMENLSKELPAGCHVEFVLTDGLGSGERRLRWRHAVKPELDVQLLLFQTKGSGGYGARVVVDNQRVDVSRKLLELSHASELRARLLKLVSSLPDRALRFRALAATPDPLTFREVFALLVALDETGHLREVSMEPEEGSNEQIIVATDDVVPDED